MKININQQRKPRKRFFRWFYCILFVIIGILVMWLYLNGCKEVFMFIDKDKLHRQYTYKVGDIDPEYITYERIGYKRYKVSLHKTVDNPGTDYMIVSWDLHGQPKVWFRYLQGPGNKVVISHDFIAIFDTVVSGNYELIPNYLPEKRYKYLSDEERDASESLARHPYKLLVYPKPFSKIRYTHHPNDSTWDNRFEKKGKIVRIGSR